MKNALITFFETRLDKWKKQQLDTNGFFVQKEGFQWLLVNIIYIIFWIPWDLLFLSVITQSPIIVSGIILCMAFFYVSWMTWQYYKFSILFYYNKWIITGGKIYSTQKEITNELTRLSDPSEILFRKIPYVHLIVLKIRSIKHTLWPIYLFLWFWVVIIGSEETGLIIEIFKMFVIYILITLLILIVAYCMQYNSIYYIFWNLWEKIQKLTPTIAEKSKQVQSQFESNMSFSTLRHWFDSLSSLFSSIAKLVIKLEQVETEANKWNLFDSEKYINSLRLDIVTPLISLKIFLEEKKIELTHSQEKLTRIRVWGNKETGNIELQSKRSELLIRELTENIEKLDTMIGKMRNK